MVIGIAISVLLAAPAAGQPVLVDRIVASVGSEVVTRSMIDLKMKRGAASRARALEQAITELVIQNECDRLRIRVEPTEVDRALQEVAAANQITQEQLIAALTANGYDLESYRKALELQIAEMRWVMQQGEPPNAATTPEERIASLNAARVKLVTAARERAAVSVREGEP